MTPQTSLHRLMAASALLLVLQAAVPALAQTTALTSAPASAQASAPALASAPTAAPTRAVAPEPAAIAPSTPNAAQDLRYGAGYRARQAFIPHTVERAQQAPVHRRGRGR